MFDQAASVDTSDNATELISFYYSASGTLLELGYSQNGEKEHLYTVITNVMGDVVALYTPYGTLVGTYSYDPYGRITQIKHNDNYKDIDGILEKNPFRYRGYYYDTETGWYYLNSRYYDPEVKRFINGDNTQLITNTPENLMQYNLFMYCNGDPVRSIDFYGDTPTILGVLATAVIATYYAANIYASHEVMKDGEYFTTYGYTASVGLLFGISVSAQLAFSGNDEMAVALSAGGGPMAGIGVSGGFVSSYYPDYNEIDDIGGLFINGGGSVVIGGGLGCDIIRNPDTNDDVGYSDSILAGAKISLIETLPMESHIFPTYTIIRRFK